MFKDRVEVGQRPREEDNAVGRHVALVRSSSDVFLAELIERLVERDALAPGVLGIGLLNRFPDFGG